MAEAKLKIGQIVKVVQSEPDQPFLGEIIGVTTWKDKQVSYTVRGWDRVKRAIIVHNGFLRDELTVESD